MYALSEFLNYLGLKVLVLVFVYVVVLLLIFADLWSGIRKAKQRNEYISSYGLRKTVRKTARYFNMLIAITAIDVIQMLAIFEFQKYDTLMFLPVIPILTFLAAFFVGVIEVKSIFEKSEQKDKAKAADTAKFIIEALKDRDIMETINNTLNKNENEQN